ncbi:MAG: hypothetical protein IPK87_00310 [Planctomycetes bacterium]|nr:hypothetical protein [Planctomycetota bacterium]
MPGHDPVDDLVRRSIANAQGAPAGFGARVRMRAQGDMAARRRARVAWLRAGVSVAAAALLVAFVLMYVDFTPPAKPDTAQGNEAAPAPAPQAETPTPEGQPKPGPDAPAPKEPAPAANDPLPREPGNGSPKPQPEPEPKPAPEPAPKPEDTVETPKPEPKPEPGPTEAPPAPERVLIATVPENVKLRLFENAQWRDAIAGDPIVAGTRMQARRGNVDLLLSGGEQVRFDGEITLGVHEGALLAELHDDGLYADNLGFERELLVRGEGLESRLTAGAALFSVSSGALTATCLEGRLTLGGDVVERGTERKATSRAVQRAKEFQGDALLKGIPARVIARYDFDVEPTGGLYGDGERLEGGAVVMDQKPYYIGFRHNATLTVLPGMCVRLRFRCTDVERLELEQFLADNTMFKHVWTPAKGSDWQELELKLADIPAREDAGMRLQAGDALRNFKLHFVGNKLEIDWVEFVRLQE